jgi:hypothetical protein
MKTNLDLATFDGAADLAEEVIALLSLHGLKKAVVNVYGPQGETLNWLAIEEETLSDGSKVHNIILMEKP